MPPAWVAALKSHETGAVVPRLQTLRRVCEGPSHDGRIGLHALAAECRRLILFGLRLMGALWIG